jgi:hypothetical protein
MQDNDLNELKAQINLAKMNNPRRPIYSSSVKSQIADLAQNLTADKVSKMLGVSKSFIDKQKKISNKLPPKSKNNPIRLLQIPATILDNQQKKETLQRFVKITTPNGISIEIFCTGGQPC